MLIIHSFSSSIMWIILKTPKLINRFSVVKLLRCKSICSSLKNHFNLILSAKFISLYILIFNIFYDCFYTNIFTFNIFCECFRFLSNCSCSYKIKFLMHSLFCYFLKLILLIISLLITTKSFFWENISLIISFHSY